MTVTRDQIVQAVQAALEPLAYVHAMWSGGAAAFGRVDEWSDVDLHIDVDDEHVAEAAGIAERALASIAPLSLRHEIGQPVWHGHHQTFYRLSGASDFLLVDCVVIRHSSPLKFLEPEIHGAVRVYFDKSGVTQVPPLDRPALLAQLQGQLGALRSALDVFSIFTIKELNRGHAIEALAFFHGLTLRTLLVALRLRHCPTRHGFHTRYVYHDLPPDVARRLEPFFFVASPDDLRARHQEAVRWCAAVLDELTPAALAQALGLPAP